MTQGKIIATEATQIQQGNRRGIAKSQLGSRAGRGGKIERARFASHPRIEMDISLAGQCRPFVAGHGDDTDPRRRIAGTSASSSSLSPELDSASQTSWW